MAARTSRAPGLDDQDEAILESLSKDELAELEDMVDTMDPEVSACSDLSQAMLSLHSRTMAQK